MTWSLVQPSNQRISSLNPRTYLTNGVASEGTLTPVGVCERHTALSATAQVDYIVTTMPVLK